jgi:DEAD/DEAH box helicase domain-containing protein
MVPEITFRFNSRSTGQGVPEASDMARALKGRLDGKIFVLTFDSPKDENLRRLLELVGKLKYSEITEHYTSYKLMRQDRVLGYEDLDLPPVTYQTTGFWFLIPWSIEKQVEDAGLDFSGGLHGLEHATIGIMPFHVMCDRWDLGGLSTPYHEDTNAATIFVYDGFEGGIGLSEKAFSLVQKILGMVEELLRDCKCDVGCPACVYSPKCGNENKPMDKAAALLIAKEILLKMEPMT